MSGAGSMGTPPPTASTSSAGGGDSRLSCDRDACRSLLINFDNLYDTLVKLTDEKREAMLTMRENEQLRRINMESQNYINQVLTTKTAIENENSALKLTNQTSELKLAEVKEINESLKRKLAMAKTEQDRALEFRQKYEESQTTLVEVNDARQEVVKKYCEAVQLFQEQMENAVDSDKRAKTAEEKLEKLLKFQKHHTVLVKLVEDLRSHAEKSHGLTKSLRNRCEQAKQPVIRPRKRQTSLDSVVGREGSDDDEMASHLETLLNGVDDDGEPEEIIRTSTSVRQAVPLPVRPVRGAASGRSGGRRGGTSRKPPSAQMVEQAHAEATAASKTRDEGDNATVAPSISKSIIGQKAPGTVTLLENKQKTGAQLRREVRDRLNERFATNNNNENMTDDFVCQCATHSDIWFNQFLAEVRQPKIPAVRRRPATSAILARPAAVTASTASDGDTSAIWLRKSSRHAASIGVKAHEKVVRQVVTKLVTDICADLGDTISMLDNSSIFNETARSTMTNSMVVMEEIIEEEVLISPSKKRTAHETVQPRDDRSRTTPDRLLSMSTLAQDLALTPSPVSERIKRTRLRDSKKPLTPRKLATIDEVIDSVIQESMQMMPNTHEEPEQMEIASPSLSTFAKPMTPLHNNVLEIHCDKPPKRKRVIVESDEEVDHDALVIAEDQMDETTGDTIEKDIPADSGTNTESGNAEPVPKKRRGRPPKTASDVNAVEESSPEQSEPAPRKARGLPPKSLNAGEPSARKRRKSQRRTPEKSKSPADLYSIDSIIPFTEPSPIKRPPKTATEKKLAIEAANRALASSSLKPVATPTSRVMSSVMGRRQAKRQPITKPLDFRRLTIDHDAASEIAKRVAERRRTSATPTAEDDRKVGPFRAGRKTTDKESYTAGNPDCHLSALLSVFDLATQGTKLDDLMEQFNGGRFGSPDEAFLAGALCKFIGQLETGDLWMMVKNVKGAVSERLLSKKEKCLFNLINQLTAEAQWKNLAWTLFRKLSVPFVQRIRQYNSISAFGRDIRCLAYALRLSEEEHSVREVQDCLRQMLTMILLERNSDFALPALCYIVLLLAEHVTAVLSDVKDETVERIRQMLAIHLATMDKSLHDTTMGALQLHCGVLMETERLKIEPATAVMFNLWLEERLRSALDAGNSGIIMDEYGNVKVSLFLSESHRMCIGMLEFGQVKLMPMDDRAKLVAGKMVYCIGWLNEKLDKDNHHQEPVAERLFALASAIPALASSAHLNEKEAVDFALNCLFVSRILHSVIGSKQFPWRLLDILALLERFQSAKTALHTETNGRGEQMVVWAIDEALSIIGRCTGYALNEN